MFPLVPPIFIKKLPKENKNVMILVMVLVMNHQKRKQIISFINCHVKISIFLNFCFNQSPMITLTPWKQGTPNKNIFFEG